MSLQQITRLEQEIHQLSARDQWMLMERLAQHLEGQPSTGSREQELAAMAADPEIRAEIEAIAQEFGSAELDGLSSL